MEVEHIVAVLSLPRTSFPTGAPSSYHGIAPVDPPIASASGPAPYRVLTVGGELLRGRGVLTHDLALTGSLARALARIVGHGFDVEALLTERGCVADVTRALRSRDLSRVDALVVVLDAADERATDAGLVKRVERFLTDARERMAAAATVTLVVAPATISRADEHQATILAAGLRRSAAAPVRVLHLTDRLEVSGPAERYATWAEAIADTVAGGLTEPMVWSDVVESLDERKRQAAVRRLGPVDAEWGAMFDRIVGFAARAYGARSAGISIMDATQARYVTRRGIDVDSVAREQTMCDVAMRMYGGIIVGDARADERFRDFESVRAGAVRFYAGYRVTSPDGQPLGTLCVFDPDPRPVLSQDIHLLRDFALAAQRRIWELARASSPQ